MDRCWGKRKFSKLALGAVANVCEIITRKVFLLFTGEFHDRAEGTVMACLKSLVNRTSDKFTCLPW